MPGLGAYTAPLVLCPRALSHLTCSFLGGSDNKESACKAGDLTLISGSGRSPGEGNGYQFQHSCLETSMDRGDWQATVHGNAESDKTESLAFTFQCFSSCVPLTITSILRLFCPIRVTLAKLSTFSSA